MTAQLLMVQAIAQNIAFFCCAVFAGFAALAAVLAGLAGGAIWWIVGGALLGIAALAHLFLVNPTARRLREVNPAADPKRANRLLTRLTRLHAGLSVTGLAALFIFIMKS